jgi:hypothetical protein
LLEADRRQGRRAEDIQGILEQSGRRSSSATLIRWSIAAGPQDGSSWYCGVCRPASGRSGVVASPRAG